MIELYHENCFVAMNKMASASVDCVITDIPYNTTAIDYDINVFPSEKLAIELKRVLKPSGWLFVFCSLKQFPAFEKHWDYRFAYVWKYENITPIRFPKIIKRPHFCHELIFAFLHKDLKNFKNVYFDRNSLRTYGHNNYYRPKKNANIKSKYSLAQSKGVPHRSSYTSESYDGHREGCTILEFATNRKDCNHEDGHRVHATMKPIGLLETLVKGYSAEGSTIFDPCAGSGTTLIAADKCGRNAIGCELDITNYERAMWYIKKKCAQHKEEQMQQTLIDVKKDDL